LMMIMMVMMVMIGNFRLGLVHRKRPPQVSRIHCFPHNLPKFFMICGGLFWGASPSGN
jgi:hypothetical protein